MIYKPRTKNIYLVRDLSQQHHSRPVIYLYLVITLTSDD